MPSPRPIVGIICSTELIEVSSSDELLTHHAVFQRYVDALMKIGDVIPVLIPALDLGSATISLIERLDGLLLPGGAANVNTELYDEKLTHIGAVDLGRDSAVSRIIPIALDLKKPVLAVCRGLQELNVALGGSLIQELHETPGRVDHRSDPTQSFVNRYLPSHTINATPNSWFGELAIRANVGSVINVNSLHGQGIERLGKQLKVEATASDGTIEAVKLASDSHFAVGVQWHPEWHFDLMPINRAVMHAFTEACNICASMRNRTT